MDIHEEDRSVSLLPNVKVAHKVNGIKGLRDRIYTQFGIQRLRGKYTLADEFANLALLDGSSIVPQVYVFSQIGFPVRREILMLEFFENAKLLMKYCLSKIWMKGEKL